MIEFDYRREQLRTEEMTYRPVAKVHLLRKEGEWIAEYFYVDSGADYTLETIVQTFQTTRNP